MDIPTHPKYDHEQLKAENKELKNDIEELKLKLKQLEDELETVKSENKYLRQENYRLKNPRFGITKYKEDSDIAFYTGFPNWDTFMLCYNTIKDSASEIIYGQYKKKGGEGSMIGRPRSLSVLHPLKNHPKENSTVVSLALFHLEHQVSPSSLLYSSRHLDVEACSGECHL